MSDSKWKGWSKILSLQTVSPTLLCLIPLRNWFSLAQARIVITLHCFTQLQWKSKLHSEAVCGLLSCSLCVWAHEVTSYDENRKQPARWVKKVFCSLIYLFLHTEAEIKWCCENSFYWTLCLLQFSPKNLCLLPGSVQMMLKLTSCETKELMK